MTRALTPLPAFDPDLPRRHGADSHWACVERGRTLARCSLWWRRAPPLAGERVGVIGHYSAAGPAGSLKVLEYACRTLRSRGCTIAVGPMDGNTWRRYRLITERGNAPPFFLEPDNPDEWPGYFRAAGFELFASYTSAEHRELTQDDPRLRAAESRLNRRGVRVRSVDLEHFDEELRRAYRVALESFRSNFLYTAIDEASFLEQSLPLRPALRPELSLMAMEGAAPVGFIFALPDLAEKERGEPATSYIVKTVAVLPGRRYAGLGTLLMAKARRAAHRLGFTRAIHALMHEGNSSKNWSASHVRTFRRYGLFARRLTPPLR